VLYSNKKKEGKKKEEKGKEHEMLLVLDCR